MVESGQADSLRALVSTNALITAALLKVKSAVLAFFRTPLIVAVPLKGANTRMCIEVGGTGAKFTDRWCFGIRHSYLVAVLFFPGSWDLFYILSKFPTPI